jgi:hypothetical protein
MPPKNIRKRRKEVTDQRESSEKVQSLDNVSKTSEDNTRQLRSKKHQASLREELGGKTEESVLPSDHGVGTDVSEPSEKSSEIIRTSSTTDLGKPVEEMIDSTVPNTEVADLGAAVLSSNDNTDCEPAAKSDVADLEMTDSSTRQGNVQSTNQAVPTPTEEYSNIDAYHPPFTIYQRFIPDEKWNEDSLLSTPVSIFPDTGGRRKKEVKDNFDWLQPSIRPADKAAARNAYADNYSFKEGFHISLKSSSYSKYVVPAIVMSRYKNYNTYTVPMNHPLCNVEQAYLFLIKPVGNLLNRIQGATQRPYTRSSLKDACLGQDLFICSAYVAANEFITVSDDIELIDLIDGHTSKKIWHCSSFEKSDMLSKAVMDAYYSVQDSNPERFSDSPNWLTSKKIFPSIQFLGIVSLYTNQSGSKVTSFRLHSFVLYSFDNKLKSTLVHLALTESRLTASSALERVLQILQMVQGEVVGSTSLTIVPSFTLYDSVQQAYNSLGFSKITSPKHNQATVFSRNAIIKLSRFTNRILWGRYGQYISMQEECTVEGATLNMYCRMVSDLFLHVHPTLPALGIRYTPESIERAVATTIQAAKGLVHDVSSFARHVLDLAAGLTRIPLAVITHVIVNRVARLKGDRAFYETTLELLQYVSVAMVKPASYHKAFVGDCHSCVLYCEKCKCRFGRTGNIFQILSEATNAILYHNGLEVTTGHDILQPDENLKFVRFKQSLPMHSMTLMSGEFAVAILSNMDPDHDRCKFGMGNIELSRNEKNKDIQYLHNLDEAMRIDTFLAGTEKFMNSRNVCTAGLLLSTFDVAIQRHFENDEPTKYGGNTESFQDFAFDVHQAQSIGINCNQLTNIQFHVLLGWAYVLSRQFLLNYAYLSKEIYGTLESDGMKPSFSINDLLRQIGLDDKVHQLRSSCQEYSMLSDTVTDCDISICDRVININVNNCLIQRPHLDTVDDTIDARGTVSKLGPGWDNANRESWFTGNQKKNTLCEERQISSLFEAEESILILKTLHTVTLDYESEEKGRGYSMTCNVDDILKKDPHLRDGQFSSFFKKPTFECSNSIVTSLPFSFLQKLSVGKPVHLPKEWKASVKKDTQISSSIMTSIQLWRSTRLMDDSFKWTIRRVYRVTYDNTNRNQNTKTTAFVTERVALTYLRNEPWITDLVRPLCSTRSYKKVFFGDGAKSSKDRHSRSALDTGVQDNFWHSTDNHEKFCTEGAVANMLFHMNLSDEAEEFRSMVIKPEKELLQSLGETHVPKRVLDSNKGMDPMEKCVWILEKKFKCRRLTYLNREQFKTSTHLVSNLSKIKLPIIISVTGHQSAYTHVVAVLRGTVFDFETKAPYALSVANVEYICGPKNPYQKLVRGYVLCPSREMKKALKDHSDWGEGTVRSDLPHLFSKKCV